MERGLDMPPWGDLAHRLFAFLNTYAHDYRDFALLLLGGIAVGMAIEWSRPLEKSQPKAATRFNVMYALLAGGCLVLAKPLIYSSSLWTVQYFGGGLDPLWLDRTGFRCRGGNAMASHRFIRIFIPSDPARRAVDVGDA
jgi:hypothetical protein